jgi:transposase
MRKLQLRKIFNLDGYILDEMEESANEILLRCHLRKKSMIFAGETSKSINQSRLRKVAHSMLDHKKVFIVITQRRFYFSKHHKILWEPLPQVKPKQQSTSTFKKTL